MPLPHFLMLIATVILAAAVTLWIALSAGLPPAVLLLAALGAALVAHLGWRSPHDPQGRHDIQG